MRKTIFRLRRVRQGHPINLTGFFWELRQLFQHVQSQDRARAHVHIREGCRSHTPTVRQRRCRLPTSLIFALAVLDGKLVAPEKTSFATESMKQRTAFLVTGRPTRPHKGQVTLRPKVTLLYGQRSRYFTAQGRATFGAKVTLPSGQGSGYICEVGGVSPPQHLHFLHFL